MDVARPGCYGYGPAPGNAAPAIFREPMESHAVELIPERGAGSKIKNPAAAGQRSRARLSLTKEVS